MSVSSHRATLEVTEFKAGVGELLTFCVVDVQNLRLLLLCKQIEQIQIHMFRWAWSILTWVYCAYYSQYH